MRKIAYTLFLVMATLAAFIVPMLMPVHAPADTVPPVIGAPVWQPSSPSSTSQVTVLSNVTDNHGVKNVTLVYTTDNWKTVNVTVQASYNATSHLASAQIPAQANGGHVEFYLVAFDTSGNKAVNNNSGAFYAYDVPSLEATTINWVILGVIIAAIGTFAVVLLKTTVRHSPPQSSQYH